MLWWGFVYLPLPYGFNDFFLSCFCTFCGNILSEVSTISIKCNHNPITWNSTDSLVFVQVSQACNHIQVVWTPYLLLLTIKALIYLALMAQTFIAAFESLEYIFRVSFIGASLSEPHTSELKGGFFIYNNISNIEKLKKKTSSQHLHSIMSRCGDGCGFVYLPLLLSLI